jgi:dTDP-4-amino-4,6-dideoxygalactose transaminase
VDQLRHDARRLKLLLIEDAAHAHGAEWLGQRAGSFGDAGVFSFQNSKAMTAGEGGIVITNDSDIAEHARSLGNCGRRPGQGWFQHFELATNYRLSGLQAAVLLAQLERLGEQIRLREENRKTLEKMLPIPGLFFQKGPKGSNVNTLYLLPGRIDADVFGIARDQFVETLNAEGIPCRRFYPHPLYRNPMFDSLPHRVEPCPIAENACKDSFWLPQRALMGSEDDTRDIGRAMEKIYQAVKPKARKTKRRGVNGAAR